MKGFERMKEMRKALKIGLFGLLAHLYASTALAATGTSGEFKIDLAGMGPWEMRTAAASEAISYSTAWATNALTDAKAVVKVYPAKREKPKFVHKYGYYECRCRLQQKEGWWSAFWIQSPIIGASLDPAETGSEIDVMESFSPGTIAEHNVFTGGYGLDCKRLTASEKTKIDHTVWHRFGVLWDETGYTFYVDGKEDGRICENVSKRPEFILISTESHGYRHELHAPISVASGNAGDTFLVDYVRVFDVKNRR